MSEQGTGELPAGGARPRLFDVVRQTIRRRHYSYRTEETYLHWIRRFIYFHGKRHPRDLGAAEVTAFLNDLAAARNVAAARRTRRSRRCCFSTRRCLPGSLRGWTGCSARRVRRVCPWC